MLFSKDRRVASLGKKKETVATSHLPYYITTQPFWPDLSHCCETEACCRPDNVYISVHLVFWSPLSVKLSNCFFVIICGRVSFTFVWQSAHFRLYSEFSATFASLLYH